MKLYVKDKDDLYIELFDCKDYSRISQNFSDSMDNPKECKGICLLSKEDLNNVRGLCLANIEIHEDVIAEYEEDISDTYKCNNFLEEKIDRIDTIRQNIQLRKDAIKLEKDVLSFIKFLDLMTTEIYFSFD